MKDFHEALGSLCLTRTGLGILAEDVKFYFAFDNLDQKTIHSATTGSDLLKNIGALFFFFDGVTNALQLPLNTADPDEEFLFSSAV